MWRGSSTNFSMNTRSSPKLLRASLRQRGEALEGFLVVEGHAQALAAAAGRGLDHHRVADVLGDLDRALGRFDRVVPARDGVDLGLVRQLLRGDLVAHRRDRIVLRADEDDALFLDLAAKASFSRQEAVARMHRLGAGLLAGRDDPVGLQVALAAGRGADVHGLVGQLDMARVPVGVGVDGDGRDAHLLRGLDDAAGDFAAVGDQDLLNMVRPLLYLFSNSAGVRRDWRMRISPRKPAAANIFRRASYLARAHQRRAPRRWPTPDHDQHTLDPHCPAAGRDDHHRVVRREP